MKTTKPLRLLIILIPLGLLMILSTPVFAKEGKPGEPYAGLPVCLPEPYLVLSDDCVVSGASRMLAEMARKSSQRSAEVLVFEHPDKEWTKSPIMIAKYNGDPLDPIKVYSTLSDAAAGSNPVRTIPPGRGLHYVSYVTEARVNGKPYVQLKSGEWVRASPAGFSQYQGLLFKKTPSTAFGWVIDNIQARSAPSFTAPEVGDIIYRETPVQIFEITEAEGMEWYRIGENLWVPYLKARRARVDTNPPAGVKGDRWISVDLFDQVVMVYENRQLVFATLVSTGEEPYWTRPGVFQIYKKKPLETMTGAFEPDKLDYYYLEDVPWTMYFDAARALHGAYWRPWFGVAGTHGCVNFSLGDANWLFQWAKEGDWVYVWDASGKTPTDPKLYGAGGA